MPEIGCCAVLEASSSTAVTATLSAQCSGGPAPDGIKEGVLDGKLNDSAVSESQY